MAGSRSMFTAALAILFAAAVPLAAQEASVEESKVIRVEVNMGADECGCDR